MSEKNLVLIFINIRNRLQSGYVVVFSELYFYVSVDRQVHSNTLYRNGYDKFMDPTLSIKHKSQGHKSVVYIDF